MDDTPRSRALDAALQVLRDGEPVSLDSAARRAGLTKPGLMHHFRTKQDLMLALVDHVAERWERELAAHLDVQLVDATPVQRIRAYVDYALLGEFDDTDMVMFGDARLRESLAARWTARIQDWVVLPDETPAGQRATLTAARLLADGAWFASATGVFPPSTDDLVGIRAIADELLARA